MSSLRNLVCVAASMILATTSVVAAPATQKIKDPLCLEQLVIHANKQPKHNKEALAQKVNILAEYIAKNKDTRFTSYQKEAYPSESPNYIKITAMIDIGNVKYEIVFTSPLSQNSQGLKPPWIMINVVHDIYTAYFVDRNLKGEITSASIHEKHFLNPKGTIIVVDNDVEHCPKNQGIANEIYRTIVNKIYSMLILNRPVNQPAKKP